MTTGDSGDSGTSFDGDVYLTLSGSDATSDGIKLVKDKDSTGGRPFGCNAKDTFTFKGPAVGPLS